LLPSFRSVRDIIKAGLTAVFDDIGNVCVVRVRLSKLPSGT
jgi:hypothetical protein